jgi:predicted nucleic acid-binding Zn ribbon protein
MRYLYKCDNKDCKQYDVVVEIEKPIKDSDRHEACKECAQDMVRVWSSPGIKTSDGNKF